jgi:hypothetical protein
MPGGRRHYDHIVRVFGLFAAGFAAFILVRHYMIPADFDRPGYGFFRAGALDDARRIDVKHAGERACLDCHEDVGKARLQSRHAKVNCEACHGPMAKHAGGDVAVKPPALNPRLLCMRCHTKQPGLPPTFPSVVPAEHAGDSACTDCHQPHHPKIG